MAARRAPGTAAAIACDGRTKGRSCSPTTTNVGTDTSARCWRRSTWSIIWPIIEAYIAGEEPRSEEHTSELQSLMHISYAVFILKKKKREQTKQKKIIH